MAKKKNRGLRFAISCILSFILAVLFTAGTVMIAVKLGFLSENSVLAGMNKKDYYKSAETDFYQDAKDYTIPVGLPVEVVEGIVDSETVYNDIKGYVVASVNHKEYSFDTGDLQSRLTENVYDYFRKEGLQMNEEQITTIPKYTQMVADIYVENMKVSYVTVLGKINAAVGDYLWIGVFACVFISILDIVMLVKMHHWKHRGVRFITYSSITTVILVASPVVIVGILEKFMKPNIAPEHLYYALVNYCASGLKIFVYLSIGWIVISVALLLLIKYLKKNSTRRVKG